MRTFTYQEHIDRPPDAAFGFIMDFSRASRWRNLVRSIDIVGGGPPRPLSRSAPEPQTGDR